MRTRNNRVWCRLNDEEYTEFMNKVKKSGLKKEPYIRMVLKGLQPRDVPPVEYHKFMRELNAIGNNLNQIAYKANSVGFIDVKKYDEVVEEYREAIKRILAAIELPERINNGDN